MSGMGEGSHPSTKRQKCGPQAQEETGSSNSDQQVGSLNWLTFPQLVKVPHDPSIVSRRGRIEMPILNLEFIKMIKTTGEGHGVAHPNPPAEVKQRAIDFLNEEYKSVYDGTDIYTFAADYHIRTLYNPSDRFPSTDTRNIGTVLLALYWRSRVQSTSLEVFLLLVKRKLVTLDGLRTAWRVSENYAPFTSDSDQAYTINQFLLVFCGLRDRFDLPEVLLKRYPFDMSLGWLVTMIIRGLRGSINKVFETIAASRFLGVIDEEINNNFLRQDRWESENNPSYSGPNHRIACDPNCNSCSPSTSTPTRKVFVGYALPDGLGNITDAQIYEKIRGVFAHFDDIERHYKNYFDIPDEILETSDMRYLSHLRSRHMPHRFSALFKGSGIPMSYDYRLSLPTSFFG